MAKLYERFIRVLQNWPVDTQLSSKSLAVYIREQGKAAFSKQGDFTGNVQQCEKNLAALERITRNHWSQQYPRLRKSGALGLSAEQCKYALSEEYQNGLQSSRLALTISTIKGTFLKNFQKAKE